MERFAWGARAPFAVVLVLAGCFAPTPCPEDFVPASSGCVPADAGASDDTPMGDGCVLETFYLDDDGDEHGDPDVTTLACDAPDGYVAAGDDCDDGSAERHPGLAETCDGLDNDCNDAVDEGVLVTFYPDGDDDGHGIVGTTMMGCTAPSGFAPNSDDCDDSAPDRFPGNPELCDAIDNDCDEPMVDETFACVRNASTTCVTSCGSMGTGTCSATCTAPSTCTPPAETCGATAGEDDDCDGFVDEGAQTVGTRIELGPQGNRIVVVPTDMGYAAFVSRTGGLFARRFSDDGAMIGSEVLINGGTVGSSFDAFGFGSRIVVGWMTGEHLVGTVISSGLAPVTAPVNLYARDGFEGAQVRVGVSSADTDTAIFLFRNGSLGGIDGLRRNFPSLTAIDTPDHPVALAADDFDAAFAPSGAFIASRNGTSVRVSHYSTAGGSTFPTDVGDTSPESLPSIHYTSEHGGVVMVAWLADPSGTSADGVRVQTYMAGVSGTLSGLESTTLTSGGGVPSTRPIDLTYAGGRFVASLFSGTNTSSTWRIYDVNPTGPLVDVRTDVETVPTTNAFVSIAANADDGSVLVAGTRSDQSTRAYRRGCP